MPEFDLGSATSRTASYAGTGAAIGTAVGGPLGTAIGAGAGAIIGIGLGLYDYFRSTGDDPQTAAAKAHAYDSTFVATPQILARTDFSQAMTSAQAQQAISFAQQGAVAQQQTSLASALEAQANGTGGPSIAELQLRQGTDRTAAQAQGLIASQRGINPGMAAKLGAGAAANANQQAAGQAAVLRAQEQQAARAQLAQVLAGQRGQSIDQGSASASLFGTAGGLQVNQRGQDVQAAMDAQRINAATADANADRAAGVRRSDQANDAAVRTSDAESRRRSDAVLQNIATGAGQAAAQDAAANKLDDFELTDGLAHGGAGIVPGRAQVAGDSKRNDTVHAKLSPGEFHVIVPRSIVNGPDAPERAAAFVEALLRQSKRGADRGAGGPATTQRAQSFAHGGAVGGNARPHWLAQLADVLAGAR